MDTNSPHTDGSRAAHKTHTRTDETCESMTVRRNRAAPECYNQPVSRWSVLLHNIPLFMKVMRSSFTHSQEFLYLYSYGSFLNLFFLNKDQDSNRSKN